MASDGWFRSDQGRAMAEYSQALASACLRTSQDRASSDIAHLPLDEAQSGSRTPNDGDATKRKAANIEDKTSALHSQGRTVAERESTVSYYRNRTQPNWREILCTLLGVALESPNEDIYQATAKAEENLREFEHLRKLVDKKQEHPRSEVIYVVRCHDNQPIHYHDEPRISGSGPGHDHHQGNTPVRNLELFLERHKEVTFLVYRTIECCKKGQTHNNGRSESISVVNPILRSALINMADQALHDIPHPIPAPDLEDEEDEEEEEELLVYYPYLWWYHREQNIRDATKSLSGEQQRHMQAFAGYIEERMQREWKDMEKLVRKGKITAEYIRYLFKPGDVVVTGPDGEPNLELRAYEVDDWLDAEKHGYMSLALRHWVFDGHFQRAKSTRMIKSPSSRTLNPSQADEGFPITSLQLYPLRFANQNVSKTLRRRGEMFWRCRKRNYVSYRGLAQDHTQSADQRFMVDMTTYKRLHPADPQKERRLPYQDDLGPDKMSQDKPQLEDGFYMTLPLEIVGFNMQTKEWIMLAVDQIEDVTWNSAAFGEYLVIDHSTKELIHAVVTEHLRTEESADVISGKGNGLLILLHGAPGTGKTLTAESVAEVAKKPLFRVTCGDIGTRPEEVEEYLTTIFTLGRTWDCVVLLDEADVYLERRSSRNLERNALVSVFLRALEYYDGILILTSNRVGIFDEAFRSRIQLSLKYNKLDEQQRQQIWKNFFKRLDSQSSNPTALIGPYDTMEAVMTGAKPRIGVNTKEISEHIDDLARRELNGRQIRNIISTARKLATYRDQPLCYEHLQNVINEADKFEKYIVDLHRGLPDDDLEYSNQTR